MRKARAFQPGQTLKSPSLEATAHIRASENVDDASSSRPAAVAGGSADVDAAAGAGGRTPAAHTQVRERSCVCVVERGGESRQRDELGRDNRERGGKSQRALRCNAQAAWELNGMRWSAAISTERRF